MHHWFILGLAISTLAATEQRNVILIMTDDQGYGDLSCFGSKAIKTPHLDQLASEGRKFTSFMVASPVCTPSRAALMTGCYPKRVGLHKGVLFPKSETGLNPTEWTIADHFKSHRYATACFGKWHLGHHPQVLPTSNGFDHYYGIPYSNDMNHPDNSGKPKMGAEGMDTLWIDPESTLTKWQTPLLQDTTIIELPVDQRTITRRCTDHAITFIKNHRHSPFFLYLPYSMPHIPLYLPDELHHPNPKKAYPLVIQHIDEQIGRITQTLKDENLTQKTILIFTSDNGPWLIYKHHGGSAGHLRQGKSTNFEGGQRVPCIMWAPGLIPPNTTCPDLIAAFDLLPSLATLTKTPLQLPAPIDGTDQSPAILGTAPSSRRNFIYYNAWAGIASGIRLDNWKFLQVQPRKNKNAKTATYLFNLATDPSESNNLASQQPERVAKLRSLMEKADSEITRNSRPVWRMPKP
ncbi:MAG: sulfatase [Verrucomicrobiota bacterium]